MVLGFLSASEVVFHEEALYHVYVPLRTFTFVTLTDRWTRRAGLSASAELLVRYKDRSTFDHLSGEQ